MKKLLPSLLLSSSLLLALEPTNSFYISAGLGSHITSELDAKVGTFTYDIPYEGFINLGYQMKNFRFEIEQIYSKSDLYSLGSISASGDFTRSSQMLNFYYSAYNTTNLVLNLGVGTGVSSTKLSNMRQNGVVVPDIKESNSASYQGLLSVGYYFTSHLSTMIKYRYLYISDGDMLEANGVNSLLVGLRVDF